MTKESKNKAQDKDKKTTKDDAVKAEANTNKASQPSSAAKQPTPAPTAKADEKKSEKEKEKATTTADKDQQKASKAEPKDSSAPAQAAKPNKPAPAADKKSGNGIAVFALLIALASLAFSAWHYSLQDTSVAATPATTPAQDSTTHDEYAEQLDALQAQIEQQTNQLNGLQQQLADLPSSDSFTTQERALKQMQSAHQAFTTRFESALGNTRQDWRLAEAEHLLRMAILRLSAMQDLNSALHLVEGADQILFAQDDVAAYPAREAIAQALADIKAMPKLDRAGLFMRLGALQQHASKLDQLMPGFEVNPSALEKVTDGALWRQWLDQMSDYVRLDFNSPDAIQPLLSSQEITHIRLAVSLSIEQAQWGALNGQQQTYDQAIQQGLDLLEFYFANDNQSANNLREQLLALQGQPVSQSMPDITPALLTLQAYIQDRTLEYRTRSEVQQ